jgi:hypothetical protein
VSQNQSPEGCGDRKTIPFVPFPVCIVPKQMAPKQKIAFLVPVSPGACTPSCKQAGLGKMAPKSINSKIGSAIQFQNTTTMQHW